MFGSGLENNSARSAANSLELRLTLYIVSSMNEGNLCKDSNFNKTREDQFLNGKSIADGSYRKCDYVGPVNIYFENRFSGVHALVLPGADEVLLGVIPLEEMDVIIDPLSEQLVVHPDRPLRAQMKVK
jgi:hypothetical protein